MTYFSGIVDPDNHIRLGGYPGAFREVLGVRMEEFCPLPADGTVQLSDGSTGRVWSERGRATTATVEARFVDGPAASGPAVTRNDFGKGTAWYVATRLDADAWERLLGSALTQAGVAAVVPGAPPGLEAVRRRGEEGSWLFLLNHGTADAVVEAAGHELLTGQAVEDRVTVAAGGVAVVRERP
jgi:beta-galactosidase